MNEAKRVLDFLGPARRYADPAGPQEGRLLAARGALPLPPSQLVSVVFALTLDPDPEVAEVAGSTLAGFPDAVIDAALDGETPGPVLAHFAERFREDEARAIKIAINANADDETLCFLATLPHRRVVDTLARNQVAILRCPRLVDALGENVLTGQATVDQILEFLGLQRGEAPPLATRAEAEPARETPPPAEEVAGFDPDDTSGLPPEGLEEVAEMESPDQADDRKRALWAVVQDLSVVDKVKLARFGNAEARALLVRDRNKIVATAAIRSPKVGENEILAYAKARNIAEDVIRIIANSREWTRSYAVQLALATNPKTPIPSALKFLNRLSDRDLRAMVRARDVPGPVSQQARRILQRKGKA